MKYGGFYMEYEIGFCLPFVAIIALIYIIYKIFKGR